tara:strand:+ start:16841 stop:17377 length:537 start_codon:yes stop_codon:yes gene_type:complete
MTNKHTTEVETKALVSKKTYDQIIDVLLDHPDVSKRLEFGDKTDLFWDVGNDTVEAFVRCRYDEFGKNPGWLIKVQEGGFNKRIEINLPLGKASHMARQHDYAITGYGSVWDHKPTDCVVSLYYVHELKQHFIEIESNARNLDAVYHCERVLDLGRFDMVDTSGSLFSMVKAKNSTKR